MEAIIERIAVCITDAIDGASDPDATFTLNVIRPKILDWQEEEFKHGDVIVELIEGGTTGKTSSSRQEVAEWSLYCIVRTLPADTVADVILCRFSETIRKKLLSCNKKGKAFGGLALEIDCPRWLYYNIPGGIVVETTVQVTYYTDLKNGYKN
jgi:hypothetical protein